MSLRPRLSTWSTQAVLEEIIRTANTVLEQVDVLASIAARQRGGDAAAGRQLLA